MEPNRGNSYEDYPQECRRHGDRTTVDSERLARWPFGLLKKNADWRPSKTLRAANQRKSDNREGTTVPSSQLRQHKEAMRWIWTRQERARDSIYPTTRTKDEGKTTSA